MARTRSIIACLALTAPLFAVPAEAAPSKSALVLSVRHDLIVFRSAQLRCEPTGGTHPEAKTACKNITTADGDFKNLPGRDDQVMCTMEFNETTVAARGKWRGKKINYRESFANPCIAHASTAKVFDF